MSTASFHQSVPQIVLTDDQAQTILDAQGAPVELRTTTGERVGVVTLIDDQNKDNWSAQEIAAAKLRARRLGREYSTQELIGMRISLQSVWSSEQLQAIKSSSASSVPHLTTSDVLSKLQALEAE